VGRYVSRYAGKFLACWLSVFSVAFAVSAAESDVQPVEGLKPMAFLAGHCWKGDFPEKAQNDEHCFEWVYGGKALRDLHTVHAPGRPDYLGETMYYWDSASRQVGYLYVENLGGISRGTMQSAPGALVFPATQYIADGQAMTYRVRWTLIDEKSYEAFSEMQVKDAWVTMFKLTMKRTT
jgi:hypothetical protein